MSSWLIRSSAVQMLTIMASSRSTSERMLLWIDVSTSPPISSILFCSSSSSRTKGRIVSQKRDNSRKCVVKKTIAVPEPDGRKDLSTARLSALGQSVDRSNPGSFIGSDRTFLLEYPAQLVYAFEQACLRERIDRKLDFLAVRKRNSLRSQIDFNPGICRQREQFVMDILRHHDRQQRVLKGITLENVCERGADYRPEAELRQGPRRVLAGTVAAEVISGQQDFGILATRRVQDKIRLRVTLRIVTPVAE